MGNSLLNEVQVFRGVNLPETYSQHGIVLGDIWIDTNFSPPVRKNCTDLGPPIVWTTDVGGLHAASHETGGADEVNVAGLSGILADPQTPAAHTLASHSTKAHDELTGVTASQHHTKTTQASEITSGRFDMARMPDGTADKALIAQGVGEDPIYGDPIPKAVDESGSFTYTTGYGTAETDVSALFTTPLTGATRRKYMVYLDLTTFEVDGNFAQLYVAVKVKVDGTNYRAIDRKTIAKADIAAIAEPGVVVEIPAVAQDVQITFQMIATLAENREIYYHYVKEFLE